MVCHFGHCFVAERCTICSILQRTKSLGHPAHITWHYGLRSLYCRILAKLASSTATYNGRNQIVVLIFYGHIGTVDLHTLEISMDFMLLYCRWSGICNYQYSEA